MILKPLLSTSLTAFFALMAACGGGATEPTTATPDTAIQTGAICDTTLDTSAAAVSSTRPDTGKPKPPPQPKPAPRDPQPEPAPVVTPPKALPRMWDYGSDNCLPCIEMKRILTPMMDEYQGRVDIRIINVYQDREKTMQARIQVIPTQIFYDPEGRELFRHIGVYPRDSIIAKFREFGWE